MGHTAAVLGASGYSGAELVRLLCEHPAIDVTSISASTRAGEPVGDVLPHLTGAQLPPLIPIEEAVAAGAEVVFSCLPSGELSKHVESLDAGLVVDLADDHRADPEWVYGLTEHNRPALVGAARIANPGCYPTAVLIALVPFAARGLIGSPVLVDAVSGASGAGRRLEDRLLLATAAGSIGAYGSTRHRHVPEMERALRSFGDLDATVSFTPHLGPFERGLLASVRAPVRSDIADGDALEVLRDAYGGEAFVEVVDAWPQTKAVAGTNRTHVMARVDERAGYLIVSCAIDNLGKGAAGQALQNANLALGLPEAAGLGALGVWP
jgi:N-acetyl-gamma-glutamyl-phosphate reductase